MPDYTIPQQLVQLFKEGRVIPFIGAGFSSVFGLPNWQDLLEDLGHEVDDGMTFQQVSKYANNDYLQIAEYYYLKTGGYIGPLRHSISRKLATAEINPLDSGQHVELVNLGAQRIYTTNYDDLLEMTFDKLELPKEVIILAKDVATSAGTIPQIVKYHGDLRYEDTLVLTESKYYSRLDFESPMDLKFRADLLGRAVLFIGYSFRDLNIRVIWFKLAEMMRDVSPQDRPTSYILTFEPNPVLEALYEAVGISTIVLDPNGEAPTITERTSLLSDFMLDLSVQVCGETIPNRQARPYVSDTLLKRAERNLDGIISRLDKRQTRTRSDLELERSFVSVSELLSNRQLLAQHAKRISDILLKWTRCYTDDFFFFQTTIPILNVAVRLHQLEPDFLGSGVAIILGLCREEGREFLRDQQIEWRHVWKHTFDSDTLKIFLMLAREELEAHEKNEFRDPDLFYCSDLLKRIANGSLASKNDRRNKADAKKLLKSIYTLYGKLKNYDPQNEAMPDLESLAHEAFSEMVNNDSIP